MHICPDTPESITGSIQVIKTEPFHYVHYIFITLLLDSQHWFVLFLVSWDLTMALSCKALPCHTPVTLNKTCTLAAGGLRENRLTSVYWRISRCWCCHIYHIFNSYFSKSMSLSHLLRRSYPVQISVSCLIFLVKFS